MNVALHIFIVRFVDIMGVVNGHFPGSSFNLWCEQGGLDVFFLVFFFFF